MTMRDFPQSLAFVAFPAYGVGILEKRRPIKLILEHLHGSFLESKMASTCILMALAEYPLLFSLRHTSYDYLVRTIFVQEGLFPILGVNFCKEELPVLCLPVCW